MAATEKKTYADLIKAQRMAVPSSNFLVHPSVGFVTFQHTASVGLIQEHYKIHVNIDAQDIDKAFDALYPLLTADDTPVLMWKVLILSTLEKEEDHYIKSLAVAKAGIQNEPSLRIIHEDNEKRAHRHLEQCKRLRTGCQFTFSLHQLYRGSSAYIQFLDNVEAALVSAGVCPAKSCPVGDIRLATYFSGRYEYNEKGKYVDAIEKNPYSMKISAESRLFQKAITHFQKKYLEAADQGNIDAMYQLALMYDCDSTHTDEAAAWYKKGADNGHMGALRALLIPLLQNYIEKRQIKDAVSFLTVTLSRRQTEKNEKNAALALIDKLNDNDNKKSFSAENVNTLLEEDSKLGNIVNRFPWIVNKLRGEWAVEPQAQKASSARIGNGKSS